mmetsp:Transcript_15105/g.34388  ORF Transcript_15105/g.34388 Transcript_15105/m.34388 type:complete len:126 (+) Transcript_15105:2-379(+)
MNQGKEIFTRVMKGSVQVVNERKTLEESVVDRRSGIEVKVNELLRDLASRTSEENFDVLAQIMIEKLKEAAQELRRHNGESFHRVGGLPGHHHEPEHPMEEDDEQEDEQQEFEPVINRTFAAQLY